MKPITTTLLTAAALLLASLLPAMAQDNDKLKVFLITGHNNAAAWGERKVGMGPDKLPEDVQKGVSDVFVWHNGEWKELTEEVIQERYGPGVVMGAVLKEKVGGPIGIILHKKAFSSLAKEWDPENGDMYKSMLKEVEAAKEARDLEVMGFAWVNGQNDRKEEMTAKYAERQVEFVKSLREDLGNSELRYVTILEPDTFPEALRQEQAKAQEIPGAGIVDTAEIPQPDKYHYTAEGQVMLGQQLGEKMAELLNSEMGG
jgi:hypothetical protein